MTLEDTPDAFEAALAANAADVAVESVVEEIVEVEQEEEYDFDDDQDLTLLSYSQLYHYRHQRLKNKLDFNNYDEIGKFAMAVQKEYSGYIKQYLLKIGMI